MFNTVISFGNDISVPEEVLEKTVEDILQTISLNFQRKPRPMKFTSLFYVDVRTGYRAGELCYSIFSTISWSV